MLKLTYYVIDHEGEEGKTKYHPSWSVSLGDDGKFSHEDIQKIKQHEWDHVLINDKTYTYKDGKEYIYALKDYVNNMSHHSFIEVKDTGIVSSDVDSIKQLIREKAKDDEIKPRAAGKDQVGKPMGGGITEPKGAIKTQPQKKRIPAEAASTDPRVLKIKEEIKKRSEEHNKRKGHYRKMAKGMGHGPHEARLMHGLEVAMKRSKKSKEKDNGQEKRYSKAF